MKVACPNCQQHLEIGTIHSGKDVTCPTCGELAERILGKSQAVGARFLEHYREFERKYLLKPDGRDSAED